MNQSIFDVINASLGLDSPELNLSQMVARAIVIYIFALAIIRLSDKRFMGKASAFDFFVGIVFGTITGNAILGNAPFIPCLGASAAIVATQWVFADLSFRYDSVGSIVKGRPYKLVENGEIQWDAMKKGHISEKDLMSVVRIYGKTGLSEVKEAYLERSGDISVIFY